jgi:hypothetical protein
MGTFGLLERAAEQSLEHVECLVGERGSHLEHEGGECRVAAR